MKLSSQRKIFSNCQKCSLSSRYSPCQSSLLKLLPLIILTVGFFLYKIGYSGIVGVSCVSDLTHLLFFTLNRSMDKDPHLIVILIGQWFIQVSLISMIIYWVARVKNIRFGMTTVLFYGIRTIALLIIYFPFPNFIVWRQPFVPSFLVPYDRTRDFFFSGHTGMAVIILLQVWKLGLPQWVKGFCWMMLIWLVFMLLASRVHYVIDIVGGVLFAILSFDLTERFIVLWDWLWCLPALIFQKIKQRCTMGQHQQNNCLVDQQILKK